jgi:hypothetical protein
MAFAAGGLRYREQVRSSQTLILPATNGLQIYNSTVTQMSAVMLSLSVMSLLLPVCQAT